VTDVWSSEMVCPGGCYDEWIVCLSVDRDSSTDPISDGSGWISSWISMDSTDHIHVDVFGG
jgi:hypothetical protein